MSDATRRLAEPVTVTGNTPGGCGPETHGGVGGFDSPSRCLPCVAQLTTPRERLAALREAVAREVEPVVTVTHLLHLCRDEHAVLWEQEGEPYAQDLVADALRSLSSSLPSVSSVPTLGAEIRAQLVAALDSVTDDQTVLVAHALAHFLDDRFSDTFGRFFRDRSPYQPGVGDPVPLDFPDLRQLTTMPFTSPPWRLANRLDQTRHIRLAGEWAIQFRIIFDYSLAVSLAGLIGSNTLIATCHPNRSLDEFELPRDGHGRAFPVRPIDLDAQRGEINRLIAIATRAGSDVVVLPELCVTEELAGELQAWVRRPDGPRLLVVGSYHHEDQHGIPHWHGYVDTTSPSPMTNILQQTPRSPKTSNLKAGQSSGCMSSTVGTW
jgi:hypothetical protein